MATLAIEVDEKVAAMLRAQAEARQLPLSEFLQQLAFSHHPLNSEPSLSDKELIKLIDQASSESPALPADFSRRDIYSDHD